MSPSHRTVRQSPIEGSPSQRGAPPFGGATPRPQIGLSPRGSLIPPRSIPDSVPIGGRSVPAESVEPFSQGGVIREVQLETVHPLRLRLLLEIERTGSISAAAEACAIGQPSASMHLRTLEAAIGHRLVVRNGRGSSLTAAGEVVALHAARVLATLDSMRRAVDGLDAPHVGTLTIAASLTPSVVLVPAILRRFSDRYPGVRVKLRTVPSEEVVREVARGGADIGIAGEVPTTDPVIRTQLLVEELVGVAPSGVLKLDGGRVSLGELARNNLLLGGRGSSTRIVTERYLARAEYRPSRVWVFDSYEAIKRAVSGGLGVSFTSPLLVHEEIERGELIAFRVSGIEPMTRPIQLVQPSATDLTPESGALAALLVDGPGSAVERWQTNVTGPVSR